jgi:hypothetical protein
MVLGNRHITKGLIKGMPGNTQLGDQGTAVTAVAYTATGAIESADTYVTLNSTTPAMAMTIARPEPGRILVIRQIDAGTAGHTVTITNGGTFDGTNTIATFNAQYETLVLLGISDKRFLIILNHGSVGLSTS